SSRDPHFGQRIVSEHSVSHNNLWRQCTNNNRTTPLPAREDFVPYENRPPLQKISAGYRLDFLCSVASISNKDTTQILCPRYEVFLGWSSSGRGNFFLWSRLFFFELETNFSVFQFEVSGKGAAFFGNKFVQKIG